MEDIVVQNSERKKKRKAKKQSIEIWTNLLYSKKMNSIGPDIIFSHGWRCEYAD